MINSLRELDVYNKSFDMSLKIHKTSRDFPKDEVYSLTSQIRRSSKSICANITEGFAKQKTSKAEFKRYLMIAFGSCTETLVWIDYCERLAYISGETHELLQGEYEHISKMLHKLHDNVK